jgi:signal transduction histidine kinase
VNQIPEPVLTKLSVREIISEVTHLFAPELIKHNINLHTENGHVTQSISADKNLTMQVIINLMKNAIESMSNYKEGKDIRIEVGNEGNRYVNINITDNGCGIAPEDIEQIFVPFYSTKKGGSGIGLSISQQIMQKQKGNIMVRSSPGRGSVFTLNFTC